MWCATASRPAHSESHRRLRCTFASSTATSPPALGRPSGVEEGGGEAGLKLKTTTPTTARRRALRNTVRSAPMSPSSPRPSERHPIRSRGTLRTIPVSIRNEAMILNILAVGGGTRGSRSAGAEPPAPALGRRRRRRRAAASVPPPPPPPPSTIACSHGLPAGSDHQLDTFDARALAGRRLRHREVRDGGEVTQVRLRERLGFLGGAPDLLLTR